MCPLNLFNKLFIVNVLSVYAGRSQFISDPIGQKIRSYVYFPLTLSAIKPFLSHT